MPDASFSSTRRGSGSSAMRSPRTAASAGSGKAKGFGRPSPGNSPARTTSIETPFSASLRPLLPGNFST
jgi:hypothetical protein